MSLLRELGYTLVIAVLGAMIGYVLCSGGLIQ